MSERGAMTPAVSEQDTAALLATRSAVQPDHLARPRGIVLASLAGRAVDPAVVVRDWTDTDDAADVSWPGAGLLASRLRVGAARQLMLDVRHLLATGSVTITPLVLTDDGSRVVATLTPQTAPAVLREAVLGGAWRARRLVWTLWGVGCLALHVGGLSTGNAVQLLGGCARPLGAVTLAGPLLTRWAPVPETNPNQDQTMPDWALVEIV